MILKCLHVHCMHVVNCGCIAEEFTDIRKTFFISRIYLCASNCAVDANYIMHSFIDKELFRSSSLLL